MHVHVLYVNVRKKIMRARRSVSKNRNNFAETNKNILYHPDWNLMALDAHRQRFLLRSWEEIPVLAWKFCLNTRKEEPEFFLPVFEESCTRNTRLRWVAGENRANIAPSMSGLVGLWPAHFSRFLPSGLNNQCRWFPTSFQVCYPSWFDFPEVGALYSDPGVFLSLNLRIILQSWLAR